MNENNRMAQMIGLINPFKQVIYYLTIGFILSCFDIEQGFSGTIFSIASALCFYFGLRMIKKENKAFFVSYILSIVILVMTAMIAFTKATIYDIDFLIFIYKSVEIVELLLCCIGLSHYVHDKKNIILLSGSYLILKLGLYFVHSKLLFEIIFACMYIAIIFLLKKCEDDLELSSYQVKLTSVKISRFYVTMIYSLLVLCMTVTAIFASPYTQTNYEYIEQESRDYSYELLHEFERTGQHDTTNMYVYDYDEDHYLFVYHFQMNSLIEDITSFNIKTQLPENQDVLFVNVGNGKQDYKVVQENFDNGNTDAFLSMDGTITLTYYTYVNPNDHQLDIAIGYLAEKEDTGEYKNNITFEHHVSKQYPYDRYNFEFDQKFEHTHFVENGKVIR